MFLPFLSTESCSSVASSFKDWKSQWILKNHGKLMTWNVGPVQDALIARVFFVSLIAYITAQQKMIVLVFTGNFPRTFFNLPSFIRQKNWLIDFGLLLNNEPFQHWLPLHQLLMYHKVSVFRAYSKQFRFNQKQFDEHTIYSNI